MTEKELDKIWGSLADATNRRAKLTTEQHCLRALVDAHERLKELGWADIYKAPKGEPIEAIFIGASQIQPARWRAFAAPYIEAEAPGVWLDFYSRQWPLLPIMYRQPDPEKPQ